MGKKCFFSDYKKGDAIFYAHASTMAGTREVLELTVRTIYQKFLIAADKNGSCYSIGKEEKERLFIERSAAERFLRTERGEI